MKHIVAALFFISSFTAFSQDTMRVLFLGNSYTNYNNLPQLVSTLAQSNGDVLIYESNTPGGYTLEGHSTNSTSLQKIAQGNWDFVVLQQQSQMPSFPIGQVQTQTFPFATLLDSLIKEASPCAKTMFYMTWGRENGDSGNCPNWPPVCTYVGMDDLLRQRYDQMAIDNEGVVSPVGPVWRNIRANNPSLQLYANDGSHPSLAGSYAAACSFYSTIFRKDPTLISDDAGVPAADAQIIRNSAQAVVYDSLETWHIGEYDPVADFSMVPTYLTGIFTNQSLHACNYSWDFGDGTTSNLSDPIHIFPSPNMQYTVVLTSECCGFSDTASIIFYAVGGIEESGLAMKLDVHPNPVIDFVKVDLERINNCLLIDPAGKQTSLSPIKKGEAHEFNLSQFASGIYWLKIESEGKTYISKVVKE